MKLITICDPHLSPHSPAAWKADYVETTLDVLDQLLHLARRERASAVLVAGDFFHLKSASRHPLGYLIRVARLIKSYGVPVFGIAGNHDLRTGSVWNGGLEGQPLQVLQEMEAVTLLDGTPQWLVEPVDYGEPLKVCVQGASFEHASADTFTGLCRQEEGVVHVTLGHFGFSPDGPGDLFGERIYGPEELGSAFDVAVIGHHHFDQGVREIDGCWYVAHGSPCWTSCHKADQNRKPAAGMIEINPEGKISCKVIRPKLKPFAELIDVEKRDAIAEENQQLEDFTAALGERLLEAPDPEKVLEDLGLDADVRARAREYLEAAE